MEEIIDYRVLDRQVIVVAVEGAIGDWAAYIGAVKGDNHDHEYEQIAKTGNKVSEEIARAIFPAIKGLHYRS